MCFKNKKCNWCGKMNLNMLYIDIWCKWYGYHICEKCQVKKKEGILKYPMFQ